MNKSDIIQMIALESTKIIVGDYLKIMDDAINNYKDKDFLPSTYKEYLVLNKFTSTYLYYLETLNAEDVKDKNYKNIEKNIKKINKIIKKMEIGNKNE